MGGRALTRPIDIATLDIEVSPSIRAEKLQSNNFLFGPEFLEDRDKNELDSDLGNNDEDDAQADVPPVFSDVVEDIVDRVKDVVEAEIQEGSAAGALEETLEERAETTTRSDNP